MKPPGVLPIQETRLSLTHYRIIGKGLKRVEFLDSGTASLYNPPVRRRVRALFSEQGELHEPVRLGLWVLVLFAVGIVTLWLFSRMRSGNDSLSDFPLEAEEVSRFVVSAGSFSRGTLLYNVLKDASISPEESVAIVKALAKHLNPRTLNAGDRYEVHHSTSGEFQSLSIVRRLERYIVESVPPPVLDTLTETSPAGPTLTARKEAVPLARTQKTASGNISESLWASLSKQGMEANVIVELADIFAWSIDFLTETRDGDRFALTWEEERTPNQRLVNVRILGAIYDGRATGHHTATRFMGSYYDKEGGSLRKAFLHAPLNFRRISSGFTNRRFHPILRRWRPHHGTDYAAATGTPVVSVGDGTIIFRGRKGGLGNLVQVRHNGTYTTYYGHLSRFAKKMGPGTKVNQGQVIGYVGSTGLSTGPHLHFEILKNGTTVNFLTLKIPSAGSVPSNKKMAFQAERDTILTPLENLLTSPT